MSYFDEDALSNGVDKDANDDSADVEVLVMLKVESGVYENEEIMTVPTWLSVSEFIERTAIVFRETLDERRAYFLTLLKYRAKFNKFITVKLTEENFLEDGAQFELSSSVSCDTKVSNLVHRVSWAPLMSTSTDHRVEFPRTSSEYGGLPYEDDRMSVSPPEANLYTSLSCVQGTDLPEAVDRYRVARAVPCIPSLFSRIISTKPLPMPSNASFKSNEDSIGAPPAGSFFNNAKPKQNYIHQNNRRQPYRGRGKHLYNQGRNRFRTPSPPPRSRLRAWDRSSSRERGHRQSPRHRRSSPRFTRNSPSYSSPSSRSRSYSASSKSRSTSRSKSPSEENDGIKAKNK
ncbi:hypothetical protein DdX_09349 [Ditylenchus destructor]|uniref:Uncharacterized protein n=1 Tax=Ditylenchus destructor TaxID=166010 RepID=A0AAD4R695_9BILA|nr:hypothetical protein DdX_09349 [Ditylenchus destructor]